MSPHRYTELGSLHSNEETPLSRHNIEDNSFPTTEELKLRAPILQQKIGIIFGIVLVVACLIAFSVVYSPVSSSGADEFEGLLRPIGPYKLTSIQEGKSFFDNYKFYDGPDSTGSAGYNMYVGKDRATELGIANVTTEIVQDVYSTSGDAKITEEFVYMKSASSKEGPRESVRIEGVTRYNHGLFILDVRHMPAGCGVWPAWWLTDEDAWPYNGEIDIVEGINYQTVAKTALHTSDRCSMYAHVPAWTKTGYWDRATGLPDTFTGNMDFNTSKPADDCWEFAAHQWYNQGCVAVSQDEGTIGQPLNRQGGGVYALEWDPIRNKSIRSWVFPSHKSLPSNLAQAIQTASSTDNRIIPDPKEWGLPYAYFAVGDGTGCSDDHFKNMRLVFNLAFCGTVSGNRYFTDCPNETLKFKYKEDPVVSCNIYIKSNPSVLDEAYWKIKGLYVYERSMQVPHIKSDAKEEDIQN